MTTDQIIEDAKRRVQEIIEACERRLRKGPDNGDSQTLAQAKEILAVLRKAG